MKPTHQSNPEQDSAQAVHLERRTYVRLASDLDATCHPDARVREVGWPGKVRDLSQGGVGLLLKHRFRPGTQLAVELRDHSGVIRCVVQARVVHVSSVYADGNCCWLLGCAFSAPLNDDELQALR